MKRRIALSLAVLIGSTILMAQYGGEKSNTVGAAGSTVALDNATSSGFGCASGTSCSTTFVVGSGTNRALAVGCSFSADAVSAISVTYNSVSVPLVSGTDTTGSSESGARTMVFALAAPASGSHTIAVSWTTASVISCGAVSVTGADQTTPMNNGNKASANNTTSGALTVTSTNGDLAFAVVGCPGNTFSAPTQTEKWNLKQSFTVTNEGQIGPGTGTTAFGITVSSNGWNYSGANFKHA